MASYTVNITSESELEETWKDPSCPNFGFGFNESSLDDCVKIDETTWQATYNSMEVSVPRTYTYLDVANGGEITYTLPAGEYGVKP
jgi:5-deoxy-D-glucuronate isomerase